MVGARLPTPIVGGVFTMMLPTYTYVYLLIWSDRNLEEEEVTWARCRKQTGGEGVRAGSAVG